MKYADMFLSNRADTLEFAANSDTGILMTHIPLSASGHYWCCTELHSEITTHTVVSPKTLAVNR